jgi:inhibitor of KinA sporulation pathway (predicted exonuclease)
MSILKDKNFFSLDLELNTKNDGSIPKIIEVGISVGKPEDPDNIQSFNWYLDPQEPITPFITELTGITDEIIQEKAVSHETAAKEIGEIIKSYDCYINPIVWGQGDATELKSEFKERNIHFPFFGNRIFDVKTLYVFRQMVKGNSPKSGLGRAMRNCGLQFIGTPHRAICDAENTLRFFFYYINKSRELEATLQKLKDT